MPTDHQPPRPLHAVGGKTVFGLALHLDTHALLCSEPLSESVMVADLAEHLEHGDRNKAVGALLTGALSYSARHDDQAVTIAVGAVLELLRRIAVARTERITP